MRHADHVSPRITIERDGTRELLIEIPPRGVGFDSMFLFLWLCGWTAGLVLAFDLLLRKPHAFILLWLVAAVLAEMVALYAFLWPILGREVVGVNRHVVVRLRRMLGVSFKKEFPMDEVLDVKTVASSGTFRGATQVVLQMAGEHVELAEFATDEERECIAAAIRSFIEDMRGGSRPPSA